MQFTNLRKSEVPCRSDPSRKSADLMRRWKSSVRQWKNRNLLLPSLRTRDDENTKRLSFLTQATVISARTANGARFLARTGTNASGEMKEYYARKGGQTSR